MNENLVKEAIAGSKEAFVTLYGEYKDDLYRYALYRLRDPDEAEDAVSECVLAAWQGIGNLRSSSAFSAWIFRILSIRCASRIKAMIDARENLERVYSEGPGPGTPGHSAETSGTLSLKTELAEALALLNDEEQQIVLLSVTAGLSSREIAEVTGLSPGGVRSKLSRSLAKMREFLS